jgi:hypothetical protein
MFKRNPNTAVNLAQQLQSMSGGKGYEKDLTEWSLTTDKAGNGVAIIRFLPAKGENGEVVPFIKVYSHRFKDEATGKWFIDNCPTTIGRDDCPVCAANSEMWNSGSEEKKDKARGRKRKISYWANIVVIKDDANPEAVGKTFKYRFGQKIFEKIMAAASPEMDEETPIDVTDVFDGANFFLKCKQVGGFANFDDSKFGSPSVLFNGDEDKLKAVWDGMHPLQKIIAADQFKSADELSKNFARVTGANARRETSGEREVREARQENPTRVHEEPAGAVQTDDIPFDVTPGSNVGDEIDDFLKSLETGE